MENEVEDEDEWLLDEITGQKKKLSNSLLNKRKISKFELDELFVKD